MTTGTFDSGLHPRDGRGRFADVASGDLAAKRRVLGHGDKPAPVQWKPRYLKGLKVWAVSDDKGNDALDPRGTWTRYKTEKAAQRRADGLNAGTGTDRTGKPYLPDHGAQRV